MDKQEATLQPRKVKVDLEPEVEITEENFDDYFFEVSKNNPQRGQVMARYATMADFVEGPHKRDVIKLLTQTQKSYSVAASKVMQKIHGAMQPDCWRICREICEDLLDGMSEEEVEQKPYMFVMEKFFYTKEEYVPHDDPHWSVVSLRNLDDWLKRLDKTLNGEDSSS